MADNNGQILTEVTEAKPKSTFKITRIVYTEKGSSHDERMSIGEDEEESNVDDSFVGYDKTVHSNVNSNVEEIKKSEKVDSTSRFRVVKLQNKGPYIMGRWKVVDFFSEPEASHSRIGDITIKGSESGNSSRAGSLHYVHGVDDPTRNPVSNQSHIQSVQPTIPPDSSSSSSSTTPANNAVVNGYRHSTEHEKTILNSEQSTGAGKQTVISKGQDSRSQVDSEAVQKTQVPLPLNATGNEDVSPVPGTPDVADLGAALETLADPESGDNPVEDASSSGVAIDNKIEQAMDLVKSHLMLAVREEVEELKLQIMSQADMISRLEQENLFLRQAASPETLAQLAKIRQSSHGNANS